MHDQLPAKPVGTHFQCQGMHGRPRKPGSKSSAPYHPKPFPRINRDKRPCFNCGDEGHFIRDCKKPQNIALTVAIMVNRKGSNAKAILDEFSCQSQEAFFQYQREEAYNTMFGRNDVEGEEAQDENENPSDDE